MADDARLAELRPVVYAHLAGRAVTLADGTKGLLAYESWTEIADGLVADLARHAALTPATEEEKR